ncbi:NAD(+) diphosphatase [Rothia nasimurium]|uniref:NAD(+) diphosphatase n=1 Tax=Rothia nasimurium TaxID=85336 RepID=UPI001F008887|nr:NAD(+) diphosphatase [Rothia nasimurium]
MVTSNPSKLSTSPHSGSGLSELVVEASSDWFSPLGRVPLVTDRVRTAGTLRELPGFFASLGKALVGEDDLDERLYPWRVAPALIAVDRGRVLVDDSLVPLDLAQSMALHRQAVLAYTSAEDVTRPSLIFAGTRVVELPEGTAPAPCPAPGEQPVLALVGEFADFLDFGVDPLNLQGFENQEQTVADVLAARTGGSWLGLRDVVAHGFVGPGDRSSWGEVLAAAGALTAWHESSGFDERTGAPTYVVRGGWVRVTDGGRELFPRTDPAVITAVTATVDGVPKILLGQARAWGKGRYSTFAGFVDAGESLEGAVLREVYEECGGLVMSQRYLGSQPWPFPRSLMCGFLAEISNPEAVEADGAEIEEIRWFTREELVEAHRSQEVQLPGQASISRRLIEYWLGGPLGIGE